MKDAAITIRRGDLLYGPFPADKLPGMLNERSVVLEDDAWSESEGRWTTVREIVGVTSPLGSGSERTAPTLDELLGNTPLNAAVPLAQVEDYEKRDRVANILSAVGLIAIVLGTLNVAANMKDAKKPNSGKASERAERTVKEKPPR
ncbi:hypothetical protein [Haloferula sp. BvORR071]|uniref:hypothetical protein n=1 Tax=Haloferula sp. BvORR071 TaxID=1396141 RepID=UPI00055954DB|nr:hypothetical protein [Haloferula sp. BvORR071]